MLCNRSGIAFASASHSNATETNTTCNMIGSTTFELNIMDDYMTIAQTNTSNTTTETIQASEVSEVKTKTKVKSKSKSKRISQYIYHSMYIHNTVVHCSTCSYVWLQVF